MNTFSAMSWLDSEKCGRKAKNIQNLISYIFDSIIKNIKINK